MSVPLFDLHCDTLYELYRRRLPFDNHETMIRRSTSSFFSPYRQVFAVWSNDDEDPETQWTAFEKTVRYAGTIGLPDGSILAVEGGSLLNGIPERLSVMKDAGVKILTLVWRGLSCIGGAYDTDEGLTDFGHRIVKECADCGIAVDCSHASDRMIRETLDLPCAVICTHSNMRAVYAHRRNLSDDLLKELIRRGSPVGLSMAGAHISPSPSLSDLCLHIDHALDKGAEDVLCLGCDFDGFSVGPADVKDQRALLALYDMMSVKYGKALTEKIFYGNASDFADRYLS